MSTEETNATTEQKEKPGKSKKKEKGTEKLKEQLKAMDAELTEAKDKYIRLYAEFDNYKKRTIREKLEMMNSAARETFVSLLPVLDDFDRAKQSAEDENSNEVFSEGVSLVYNKFTSLLKSQGLKAMESTGEDFDPELHEAITEIPAPNDKMKGKVIDTIEKGYYLNDKIIRHAKVVVGK